MGLPALKLQARKRPSRRQGLQNNWKIYRNSMGKITFSHSLESELYSKKTGLQDSGWMNMKPL